MWLVEELTEADTDEVAFYLMRREGSERVTDLTRSLGVAALASLAHIEAWVGRPGRPGRFVGEGGPPLFMALTKGAGRRANRAPCT